MVRWLGIAALLSGKLAKPSGPTATIITGRNPDMHLFTRVITGQDVELGDLIVKGRAYGA